VISQQVRKAFAVLVAVVVAVVPAASAYAGQAPLETRLRNALDRPGVVAGFTGAFAIDTETGAVVFGRNASEPFRPASTEKLAVALAALGELGPDFRTETVVLGAGTRKGKVWKGDLILKGLGDPDLQTDDLDLLAREIRGRGIRRVAGRVVADESYFDRRRTAPGWKPAYYKIECPPLSALVANRAVLDGRTTDDPALAAAIALKRALERAGIQVGNAARKGKAPGGAVELARVDSPPLRKLVKLMDTQSDNFVAEMLLKLLGAHELGKGTTSAGARVVRRELAERGVPLAGVRIVDGSGLSQNDRLTAIALASILTMARNEEEVAGAFRSSLAVAGITGTLEDRMEKPPARGRVRGKTGTTAESSALAGYAGSRFVFALIMNGNPVNAYDARAAQDRFATILAGAA
jgi:D-alanyl-D-alanine carboxypeptidase/D-alanyl-D-alanine-endopeptidase (penicillin-binding protein 4)